MTTKMVFEEAYVDTVYVVYVDPDLYVVFWPEKLCRMKKHGCWYHVW